MERLGCLRKQLLYKLVYECSCGNGFIYCVMIVKDRRKELAVSDFNGCMFAL